MCYNDQVLPYDWFDREKSICVSDPSFVWGFSSLLAMLGFVFQLVWVLGLYIVWLNANLRSAMCKRGRKLDGVYRNATELVGAMTEDLGDKIHSYSNKEFKQALASCRDIGWVSQEGHDNRGLYVALSSKAEDRGGLSLRKTSTLRLSLISGRHIRPEQAVYPGT